MNGVAMASTSRARGGAHLGEHPAPSRRLLPEGWPILAYFTLFPLWWVLGLGELAGFLLAVPMAVQLLRQPHVRAPRGFGVWLLFLVWAAIGVLVLQVDAPGAVADTSIGRYGTMAYRMLWYVSVTVMMLYVLNNREQLPSRKLFRAMSYMFITVVCGGFLGMLMPLLQFPSVLELVLPHSIGHAGFVQVLIHPSAAQVQSFLGYSHGRPSAPFTYTNDWGLNYACFLPAFIVSWCAKDAGWRRIAGPIFATVSLAPVVYSLDRGLWLALIAMFLFVAVRFALAGRFALIGGIGAAIVAAMLLLVLSPLGGLVQDRLEHPNSNQGRTNLGNLTVTSVEQGSPIVGYGSTRNVQGNFNSIAAGSTVKCPRCSPPPLGTQGQFSLVVFSEGFGGVLLYIFFFGRQFLANIRLRSRWAVAALCMLVVQFVTMPVYSSLSPALGAIFIGIAVLDLERSERRARARVTEASVDGLPPPVGPSEDDPLVSSYLGLFRRHIASFAVCMVIGAVVGAAVNSRYGLNASASQSVFIPTQTATLARGSAPLTIDTVAKIVTSQAVVTEVEKALGSGTSYNDVASNLVVTASPNTRILHVRLKARSAAVATKGVQAATAAFANEYLAMTTADRARDLGSLTTRATTLTNQLLAARTALLGGGRAGNPALRREVGILRNKANRAYVAIARLRTNTVAPAQVLAAPTSHRSHDGLLVGVASGLSLGFCLAAFGSWLLDERRLRVRASRRLARRTGLPILIEVLPVAGLKEPRWRRRRVPRTAMTSSLAVATSALMTHTPASAAAATMGRSGALDVAEHIDGALRRRRPGAQRGKGGVLIVTTDQERLREVVRLHKWLERTGQNTVGIVLVAR